MFGKWTNGRILCRHAASTFFLIFEYENVLIMHIQEMETARTRGDEAGDDAAKSTVATSA